MPDDFIRLADEWAWAEGAGDAAALDALLEDNFVGIGLVGFVLEKRQWLGRFGHGALEYKKFGWRSESVHRYDETALVAGELETEASYQGKPVPLAKLRVMQVFVRIRDEWKLAAVQHSPIQQPS